jgi:hypothetical protein
MNTKAIDSRICHLVAVMDADAWYLCWEDENGNSVREFNWPSHWPEAVNASFLRAAGFEIVHA